MELELERTQLNGCKAVLNTTVCHEETLEMIVSDACPDILRICDTEGTALLKSKEAQEGRAAVTGTARAAVLYLPDGAEGMRCIEVNIPFSCGAESALVTGSCSVVAQPRVRSAETRILNPRKVLVKVDLAIDIQVYAPITDSLCTGVSDPESVSAEELTESCRVYLATCIQEKPFTFEDELSLSGGKP